MDRLPQTVSTPDGVSVSLDLYRKKDHTAAVVIVGVEHSRRLYAMAGEPKRLEIIEGGSHAEALFRDDPDRFVQIVSEWLSRTLASPA